MAFSLRLDADRPPRRTACGQGLPAGRPLSMRRAIKQQATCQFGRRSGPVLAPILHGTGHQGQAPDDVDAVSSLSEPYGPDRAMADRGGIGAAISQPRSAGRLRPAVRTARRSPRAGLAHLADLYPSRLWHRPGAGRQSRAGSERGGRLRDAVRLAAAFQEGSGAGAAAHAAGGADVRPLRDAAARHGEDAAAGPRRLHHRLAQSARHSARRRQASASTITPGT